MIYYEYQTLTKDIINEIRKSVGWKTFHDEQLSRALENTVYSVVAYEDNHPIAMGRLIGDGIYYLICDVAVNPHLQGQGIGSTIMDEIIKYVRDHLKTNERCSIQLIAASGKESFYKKFGFSPIPNENSGHGMQLFISNEI